MPIVKKDFTANSQTSDSIRAKNAGNIGINVDFTTASGAGTVALQRKIGSGAWMTIESYTADATKNIEAVSEHCSFQCTTTAHSANTITVNMASPNE